MCPAAERRRITAANIRVVEDDVPANRRQADHIIGVITAKADNTLLTQK